MNATIFDIKRFAVHDGDGIRTTVFFKGCPLQCVWCHNPEGLSPAPQLACYSAQCLHCGGCVSRCPSGAHTLSSGTHRFRPELCTACGVCASVCPANALTLYGRTVSVSELLPILLEDRDFYDNSGGGVTLSGGECLMQADFCAELLRRLKENGVRTAVDTCGFVPRESIDKVLPYTDVFLYDLKAVDEAVHVRCTGRSNAPILDNLRYLDRVGACVELRVPYVPDWNDGEMEQIAAFSDTLQHVSGVRLLPYHNYAGSKYEALGMKNTLPPTLPSEEALEKARSYFHKTIL